MAEVRLAVFGPVKTGHNIYGTSVTHKGVYFRFDLKLFPASFSLFLVPQFIRFALINTIRRLELNKIQHQISHIITNKEFLVSCH